jgi:ribosome maturation protein SDO1
MTHVVARIKIKNKHFEIDVDLDEALKAKAGKGDVNAALITPQVFYDLKKGLKASKADLIEAFGTDNITEIAKKIITSGEVQKTQEFRDEQREVKIKQVIQLIIRNSVDQFGRPYTEDRIKRAIDEVHYNFDNRTPEQHLNELVEKLQKVIPIKLQIKKIKLTIPAQFTAQVYGLLKDVKESEDWLANGALQAIINIPAGMQIDFYDKLNKVTHGAVQSEEVLEKK